MIIALMSNMFGQIHLKFGSYFVCSPKKEFFSLPDAFDKIYNNLKKQRRIVDWLKLLKFVEIWKMFSLSIYLQEFFHHSDIVSYKIDPCFAFFHVKCAETF